MSRRPVIASLILLALTARGEPPASPKVIERYKQMLEKNPGEGTALDRLWKSYQDEGATARLLDEYKAGGTFASELVLGHLLKKAGRTDEALAAFARAAKLDEKNALAPLAIARLQNELGHFREAAEAWESAIALLPPGDDRTPETLMQLGAAWLAAGDAAKAADAWEHTASLRPEDLELRRRLADTYAQNNLPKRAIHHLEYLDAHAPAAERALALQQLARIHQGTGNQDAAIAALEKALALTAPGNWLRGEIESQLIRLHQRYHRVAELEERWRKFAAENPRDPGACLQLVGLYERLGDLEQERTWLVAATGLAPKNAEYRHKLARLLVHMDMADDAASVYDALLKEQPANIDYVFERAKIDMQRDEAPLARKRIAALLAARKDDEAARAKALEFYQQNQLLDLVEERLTGDATGGGEEAVLALANFYFAQHRDADAKRTLAKIVAAGDPPKKQAAAHARVAQVLKTQSEFDAAATELSEAARLDPGSRDLALALGELHATRADFKFAQAWYRRAVTLSRTEAEKIAADQKLFDSLRSESAPAPISVAENLPDSNPAVVAFIAGLQREAASAPDERAWLRVARWRLWQRDTKGALDAAQRALALNAKSIDAYELLVKLHSTGGASPLAVFHLAKLAEIDPANRAAYRRRAGQLELQAGRITEALAIFEELAKANPGSVEALTDLALTQQRAERWTDALATWRQVYAASPVSRKKEAFTPLLFALDKLGMRQPSAELQLKAIETEADMREQFSLFGELLAHCTKYALLDWLRVQFEAKRKLRADDYFTEMALGRIFKAAGNRAAAFEVLADASFGAENPAEALPELVREAEDLRRIDAAAQLQERFLRVVPQDRPDGFEKLAQLQEKDFDIEGAARTWERIVAKFPRDAGALSHAVDFHLQWGSAARAAELLRRVREIQPENLRALATLAAMDIEAGDAAEAEACLEQILLRTPREKTGEALVFPAMKTTEPGRLQTTYLSTVGQRNGRPTPEAMRALKSFWVSETPTAKGDRELRLNAIRQLAEITAAKNDPTALATWTRRWSSAPDAPGEALWALYYAGASEAVLDRIEAMMADDPREVRTPQAFIWLALQTRQFDRLGAWLRDSHRTASERDYVSVAIEEHLDANGGRIDPALIEKIYAPGSQLRLWQGATLFAARNHFAEAARLGERFFDGAVSQRAACGRELARWHLFAGDIAQMRAVLRETIKLPADSFMSPVCGALRDYFLLLPEAERAQFVGEYLGAIDETRQPLHAAVATVILRGLSGEEKAAQAALEKIIELRPLCAVEFDETGSSAARRWRFVLQAGLELQSWKLEKLAIFLWEKAVADEALVQLQGDQAQSLARDIRQQLSVLQVAYGLPGDVTTGAEAYVRASSHEGLLPLASTLLGMNANGPAVAIHRQLWERDPGDPEALRNLLAACRAAGDEDTAEEALWTSLGEGGPRMNEGARRELVLQLVDLLDHRGELEQAGAVLRAALHGAPAEPRLQQRLGQLCERAGRADEAAAGFRAALAMEPGNATARLMLSSVLEKQGRLADAIAVFQGHAGADVDARLALLFAKNSQPEDALAALDRLPPSQHVASVLSTASAFLAKGERKFARAAVQAGLARSVDARMNFALQSKLLEALAPEDGPVVAQREMRRLRQFAGDVPALLGSWLDAASRQAARLHVEKIFSAELTAMWAEGTGPVPAGVTIFTMQLEAGDRKSADATLDQILAREAAPVAWLQRAGDALAAAKLPEALVRVRTRIVQLDPGEEDHGIALASTLRQLGRLDAARETLEPLALRAALNDEIAAKVARAYAELGDPARAQALYAQAMQRDAFARNTDAFLECARLQIGAGDFSGAKKTLRAAFANPANRHFEAIIEWLAAAGRMENAAAVCAEFSLTPPRLAALRRALFAHYDEAKEPAAALAVMEAHPGIFRAGMTARLREMAKGDAGFEAVAAVLEKLCAQSAGGPDLVLALALVHADWAAAELAGGRADEALAHFAKAHERRPEIADVAMRLSALQAERGDRKGAIATLESFLAVAVNAAEIEQARSQLAKVKAGS